MGIPIDRFVNPVDENLICGICHGVFIIPVVTECGHTFCANCLKIWLNSKLEHLNNSLITDSGDRVRYQFTCPTCRAKLNVNHQQQYTISNSMVNTTNLINSNMNSNCFHEKPNINLLSVARPVLALKNFLNSLQIYCEYAKRGCTTIGSVETIHFGNHKHVCAYVPVDCAGCGRTLNRIELAAHQLGCFGIQAELGEIHKEPIKTSQELQSTVDVGIQTLTCFQQDESINQGNSSHLQQSKEITTNVCNSSVQTYNENLKSTCDFQAQTDFNHNQLTLKIDQHYNNRSLQLLNISLIKLVHALRVELDSAQEELYLRNVKQT
ncbi:E3 ubiquitin-protein ligase PDZRN3 [Schistosoma japonicum]|uniref:E3 ubiquitin-protein ligase PDZRN3 n=1 Tax=Schistosoma japonicum TaxID=6182 RepID=A0A4Z2CXC0_SCHJA|nr:E3 ubiquitin-protein ligase PDZRN3 [Schistosoma japonicum]